MNSKQKMVCVPVYQSTLREIRESFKVPIDERLQDQGLLVPATDYDMSRIPEHLRVIGVARPGVAVHMPNVTDIVASPLQHDTDLGPEYAVFTKPANLSRSTDIKKRAPDAYFMGKQKYDLDKSSLSFIRKCSNLLQRLEKPLKLGIPEVLSFLEVINGIPGTNINGCNAKTSPGWPWVKLPGSGKMKVLQKFPPELGECGDKTRLTLCDCEECYYRSISKRDASYLSEMPFVLMPKRFFRIRLDKCLAKVKKGIIPNWIYTTIPKDELRDAKVIDEMNKTRYILVSPFDQYIIMTMYFGAWINDVKSQTPLGPNMVGTNMLGIDMQFAWQHLNEVANIGFICGDYKGFDIRLFRELRAGTGEVVRFRMASCYGTELDALRKFLWESGMTIVAIHGNFVYVRTDGKASGDFVTAEENGENNKLMVFCSFMYLAHKNKLTTVESIASWKTAVRGI
jgi:hypothetical protein